MTVDEVLRSLPLRTTESADGRNGAITRFRVEGIVDGRKVTAELRDDVLFCDAPLLGRVEIVVAIGDSFIQPDGLTVPAAIGGDPRTALLSLVRACDQVSLVECGGDELARQMID